MKLCLVGSSSPCSPESAQLPSSPESNSWFFLGSSSSPFFSFLPSPPACLPLTSYVEALPAGEGLALEEEGEGQHCLRQTTLRFFKTKINHFHFYRPEEGASWCAKGWSGVVGEFVSIRITLFHNILHNNIYFTTQS